MRNSEAAQKDKERVADLAGSGQGAARQVSAGAEGRGETNGNFT